VQGKQVPLSLINITPKADNNQLYSMRLSVPASAAKDLTAGMNVEVDAEFVNPDLADSHAEFEVPVHAVFYDNANTPHVWALAPDSTVVATKVELGDMRPNGKITVTSGLTGNETIIRAGVNSLKAGEKVTVIEDPNHTNVGNLL
jgi:multidrug efflux pump subunit AcrA (membrane-fusion protein)